MKPWQRDLAIIILSTLVAVLIVKTHLLSGIFAATSKNAYIGSFVSGIFFTSFFTIPLSTASFIEILRVHGLFSTAIIGAFGALLGDIILFNFAKNNIAKDLDLICKHTFGKKCVFVFKKGVLHYITPILGALIIASPLPDELGLAMMGISKIKLKTLIPISLCMNFLGILIIGYLVQM